jgi:hypothetical protein
MKQSKHVKIAELEIPKDYWSLNSEEKELLTLSIMDVMLTILDRQMDDDYDRVFYLNKLLESSIETNMTVEQYEIVEVLNNIKKIINAETY